MLIRKDRRCLAILLGLFAAASAEAQEPAPEILPPVIVTAPPPVSSSSEQLIPGKDFELRPEGRPADILRLIPGLIISQHQGGGKADQYLIRGFDADHGTDIALFVDGLPVNLRSHAHGQGYADLHFLIPETLKRVDATKGPYFPEYGDFDTAAAVNFVAKENVFEVAGGSFNTQRYLALLSPTRDSLKTLIALEGYRNDGPFQNPNGYSRFNIFAKASAVLAEDMKLSLWASHYRADWHGSGQIPARAVREGMIDRFGSIDPSEGGNTQRTNLNADFSWKPRENHRLLVHAYVTYYALNLFNDFTFFLNNPDPTVGDEINQRDHRFLAGLDTQYDITTRPFGIDLTTTGVVLANATQRHRTSVTQDVNIVEQSY